MLNCDSSPVDLLQYVSLSITAACMTATYRHFWFSDLTFNMWCSNHLGKTHFWLCYKNMTSFILQHILSSPRDFFWNSSPHFWKELFFGCLLLFCSLSAIIIWALRRPINGWWCCIAFIVLALFGDHCCTKNWSGWQSDDFQMVLN